MDFDALVTECAPWVAPQTMAAIVKTESQFKPFAININGKVKLERQPTSKEEAIVTAKWLIANNYNIDMGLGQVNSVNLPKVNLNVEEAFDACKNIAAAATILQWNYQSAFKKNPNEQEALHAAISAYNTGSFTKGFNNGYVQKVVNNARAVSPTGSVNQSEIKPIPLKNIGKIRQDKAAQMGESVAQTVKLRALPPSDIAPLGVGDVYGNSATGQSVMVY
ncbi:MAG: conjugal transfer protein [Betaproteobacteria bacterium HGW-Betaproteobacteria-22]|nr:MAG: conjugal transfer protein [Betaproteobacteria bacterium HGW-Betaproteobacteria-22]